MRLTAHGCPALTTGSATRLEFHLRRLRTLLVEQAGTGSPLRGPLLRPVPAGLLQRSNMADVPVGAEADFDSRRGRAWIRAKLATYNVTITRR